MTQFKRTKDGKLKTQIGKKGTAKGVAFLIPEDDTYCEFCRRPKKKGKQCVCDFGSVFG